MLIHGSRSRGSIGGKVTDFQDLVKARCDEDFKREHFS
ncbi:conserved hypothetical protein [delta proteobacterium NaphS2]|nr:conserved hypothetical protein [delta proteobacterium NaphS2]